MPLKPSFSPHTTRVRHLILYRYVVLALVFLGLTLMARLLGAPMGVFPGSPVDAHFPLPWSAFYLLAAHAILNSLWLLLLPWAKFWFISTTLQLTVDVVVVTGLTYLTGGLLSPLIPLHCVIVLTACLVINPGAGLVLASLSTVGLGAMGAFIQSMLLSDQPLPALPASWSPILLSEADYISRLLQGGGAFFLVALLGGRLSRAARAASILAEDLMESLDDAMLVVDHNDHLQQANQKALQWLGGSADDFGKALDEIPWLENQDRILDLLFSKRAGYTEFQIVTADDHVQHLEAVLSFSHENKPRVILSLRDINARNELDKIKQHQHKSETLTNLATSIAHELRNPLAALRSCLQAIREQAPDLDGEHRRLMQVVFNESDRLDRMIDDFLQFARAKPARLAPVNLKNLLLEVVDLMQHAPEAKGKNFQVRCPSDLEGKIDTHLMKQALINLLQNACHATGDQGLAVLVAEDKGLLISLEIRDNGPGLPDQLMTRLKEPFFTTKDQGTGMGLAVADQVARAHKQGMDMEQAPEGGACFRIWIEPAADA